MEYSLYRQSSEIICLYIEILEIIFCLGIWNKKYTFSFKKVKKVRLKLYIFFKIVVLYYKICNDLKWLKKVFFKTIVGILCDKMAVTWIFNHPVYGYTRIILDGK